MNLYSLIWLSALAMELGAWFPWFLLVSGRAPTTAAAAGSGAAAAVWLCAVMALAGVVERLIAPLAPGWQRRTSALAGLLAAGAAAALLGPPFRLTGGAAVLAFWRGQLAVQYAGDPHWLPEVAFHLLLAPLGLLALGLFPGLLPADWSAAMPRLAPYLVLYFVAALAALALARIASLRRQWHAGPATVLSRPGLTVAVASLLLALAGLAAWVLSSQPLFPVLAAWAARGVAALSTVLAWVVFFFAWVIGLLLTPLVRLLRGLVARQAGGQGDMALAEPLDLPDPAGGELLWIHLAARWVAAALLLLSAVLLLARAAGRRSRTGAADDVPEQRESVFAWQRLRSLVSPFRRRAGVIRPDALPPGQTGRVRALFRRLQRLGAALGRPRQPWETPAVFAEALSRNELPGQAGAAVAQLYTAVRYGEAEPDAAAVDLVEEKLAEVTRGPKLRATGRRRLPFQK